MPIRPYILCLYIALCLFTTVPFGAFAQLDTLAGTIVDDRNAPLEEIIIENMATGAGTVTDDRGRFAIIFARDSIRKLAFYAMGYERKEMDAATLLKRRNSLVLILRRTSTSLKTVTVHGKKEKTKLRILGREAPDRHGSYYMRLGDELAICLQDNPDNREGYLKQVFVYITDEGMPNATFRLKISKKDTGAELRPGANLAGDILLHATKGNEWISVDVSNKRIPTLGGIFVTIELPIEGNSDQLFPAQFPKAWCSMPYKDVEGEYLYNGMVVGSTCDYGVKSRTFQKNGHLKDWYYCSSPYSKRREYPFGHIFHWFNPAIYCTYTYSKK